EDALSSLINNIELPLKQVDNRIENLTATQDNTQDNQAKLLESKPFRTPLKSLSQSSEQQNFQSSEQQESYECSYQTSEDRMDRNMIQMNPQASTMRNPLFLLPTTRNIEVDLPNINALTSDQK
ncbi:32921_t:CDS:2, partial [Racocetra persica]